MLKEIFTVFLEEFAALLTGILFYKYLPKPWRLLCLQVCIAFIVETAAYAIRKNHQPNGWLYNIYLVIDCGLHLLIAYYLLNEKHLKPFFIIVFSAFIVVWCYDVFYKYGLFKFATHAYIADSFLLIISYLYLLFKSTLQWQKAIYLSPIFWLCMAIIIFYGCNFSYFALMDIIFKSLSKSQNIILLIVLKALVAIRYILIACCFYLVYYNQKKQLK